jgi:DNA-binding transcriptional LysR family regulator
VSGPTLRQIRAFLVTAEEGSASAAGKRLRVSQSAVSQQIHEFERQLQVRLLERLGSRFAPTPAGQALIEPVRRMLAALGDIDAAAAPFRHGNAGRVRMGTGATACIHFLPGPLERAKRRMPGLDLFIITGNTPEIVAAVADGSLDVGLVTAGRGGFGPMIETEDLYSDDIVAILPKATARDIPNPVRARELADLPLVLFEPGGATRDLIDRWFQSARLRPSPVMELGSVEAIKVLVRAGFACSLIPRLAIDSDEKQLAVRLISRPIARKLCLVLRSDKVLDRGLRTLLEELRRVRT